MVNVIAPLIERSTSPPDPAVVDANVLALEIAEPDPPLESIVSDPALR